jgi:hypothetical protein
VVVGLAALASARAPVPPDDFPAGVTGTGRGIDHALADAAAAGFNAVRLFVRWDEIEPVEATPRWDCRYTTKNDLGPDVDGDGQRDLWPDVPCDGTPCGCGFSLDERVAAITAAGLPLLLTIHGTPAWARGPAAPWCPAGVPGRAFPVRADRSGAYARFVAAVAARYGEVAFAFELWNEPDLDRCGAWAGTREQYRRQILGAAAAVKASGATPGLVVAPTLVYPSPEAFDAWIDWRAPIDRLSLNLYTRTLGDALRSLDTLHTWCARSARCPGFWITEFAAQRNGVRACPGPRVANPGAADLAIMRRCRRHASCRGFFLYSLTDRNNLPLCDEGLLDASGCRKRRLCQIGRRYFGREALPYACVGCGP